MKPIVVIALFGLVYYLTREIVTPTPQVTVGGDFTTKYFAISGGDSKNKFNELKDGGMSPDTLRTFAQMEDQFLGYEYQSVLGGGAGLTAPNRVIEATRLSEQIKDAFPGYEFGYHAMHIKQMSEPNKKINPYLH